MATKIELERLLAEEMEVWSTKPFDLLVRELADVVAFARGSGEAFHQFEAQIIERTPDTVHVCLSVDDGSLRRSFAPLTRGFIAHRDGRIER